MKRAARLGPRPGALLAPWLGALLACGHAPPPAAATAQPVRAELDLAERAELARDHATARRHYEAAVVAAMGAAGRDLPSLRLARREFAETLISWGELPAAADQLAALVAADPRNAAAWHDLGMVRHALGDGPAARAALTQARSIVPSDPRPRIALAALYWKLGELAAARAEYTALLELSLPERVRDKVTWALQQLAAKAPQPRP
jgi:Flp pilus assembly protein TadD